MNLSGAFLLGLWPASTSARKRSSCSAEAPGRVHDGSTWMVETDGLIGGGRPVAAWRNLLGSLVAGLAVAGLGLALGAAVA